MLTHCRQCRCQNRSSSGTYRRAENSTAHGFRRIFNDICTWHVTSCVNHPLRSLNTIFIICHMHSHSRTYTRTYTHSHPTCTRTHITRTHVTLHPHPHVTLALTSHSHSRHTPHSHTTLRFRRSEVCLSCPHPHAPLTLVLHLALTLCVRGRYLRAWSLFACVRVDCVYARVS